MSFIYESIAWVLSLCYNVMFKDYMLALLLFALIVKILMLPLGIKQHTNSLKQAKIRPLEAAIVKKYRGKNDRASQQKRQLELQTVQQKAGYSQFAGCLPLLIQLPVIILIYNVIRNPLSYICRYPEKTIKAIKEIAGKGDEIAILGKMRANPDLYLGIEKIGASSGKELLAKLPDFNLFGIKSINLANTPSFSNFNWLLLIPVLTFICTFITTKLTKKFSYRSPAMSAQGDEDTKLSLMIMDFVMPAISTWITFSVPAVIGIYWIYQNLLGVLQQFIMVKIKPFPQFTEEDYKEAERAVLGKKKKNKRGLNAGKDPNGPRVPSLHHIDDEDYQSKVVYNEESKPAAKKNGSINIGNVKD